MVRTGSDLLSCLPPLDVFSSRSSGSPSLTCHHTTYGKMYHLILSQQVLQHNLVLSEAGDEVVPKMLKWNSSRNKSDSTHSVPHPKHWTPVANVKMH